MAVDLVHALPELRIFVRKELSGESVVFRLPRLTSVVGAVNSGGRDCHERSLPIVRIENDGVQAQAASSGLPLRPVWMVEQSAHERVLPGISGVSDSIRCRLHSLP